VNWNIAGKDTVMWNWSLCITQYWG